MLVSPLPDFIEKHTGITAGWAIGIVIMAYILFFAYFILKGTAYFSYNDDGAKIIIRTFRINTLGSKKLSIEINKGEFHKYQVNKGRLKEEITLFVRKGTKISKYPPLSIVSLTREQKKALLDTLDKWVETKEKTN